MIKRTTYWSIMLLLASLCASWKDIKAAAAPYVMSGIYGPVAPEIFKAVAQNELQRAEILFDQEPPYYARDKQNRSVLHVAIDNQNPEMLRMLLQKGGRRLIDASTRYNKTILYYAASKGNLEILQILLASDAKKLVNAKGIPSLHGAIAAEDAPSPDANVVHMLLDAGADPNGSDETGITALHKTALHRAAVRSYKETAGVIQMLLDGGASVDGADIHKRTPLHVARDPQTTHALIAHQLPGKWQGGADRFCILVAALLSSDPDINFQCFDKDGKTTGVIRYDSLLQKIDDTERIVWSDAPILETTLLAFCGMRSENFETIENPRKRVRAMLNKRNSEGQTALESTIKEWGMLRWHALTPFPGERNVRAKINFLRLVEKDLEKK